MAGIALRRRLDVVDGFSICAAAIVTKPARSGHVAMVHAHRQPTRSRVAAFAIFGDRNVANGFARRRLAVVASDARLIQIAVIDANGFPGCRNVAGVTGVACRNVINGFAGDLWSGAGNAVVAIDAQLAGALEHRVVVTAFARHGHVLPGQRKSRRGMIERRIDPDPASRVWRIGFARRRIRPLRYRKEY